MRYLIAYDITSPQRLRRVARILERHAIRCQKSVFVAAVTPKEILQILDLISAEIHPDHDIVQAWRMAMDETSDGLARGALIPLQPTALVFAGEKKQFVTHSKRKGQDHEYDNVAE